MPDEVVALLLVSLFWMRIRALALHRRDRTNASTTVSTTQSFHCTKVYAC